MTLRRESLADGDREFTPLLTPTPTRTAAYVAAAGDLVVCDATTGGFTVTLPASPLDKTRLAVKKVDATSNPVTVTRGGLDLFHGAGGVTSIDLLLQNHSVTLQYDSARGVWHVVSDDLGVAGLDARYGNTVQEVTYTVGPLPFTATSPTDLTGMAVTVNSPGPSATWLAFAHVLTSSSAANSNRLDVRLLANNAPSGDGLITQAASSTALMPMSRVWPVTGLPAGARVLKLQAQLTGTGSMMIYANTALTVVRLT